MSIRKGLVAICVFLSLGSVMNADAAKKAVVKPANNPPPVVVQAPVVEAPLPSKIALGTKVNLGGVDVVLNQVVPPGKNTPGGEGFAEYNFAITNTSPDKEFVLSNVTFGIAGAVRPMVKDLDDIVNQDNSTGKTAATTAGAAAIGFLGGLLGPVGALASMVGTSAAGNKIYVDDPQKWRDELKKRSFASSDSGIAVFPSETATGSIWVNQSGAEVAERIQLYIKQGTASRLVKLDLEGMPAPMAAKE